MTTDNDDWKIIERVRAGDDYAFDALMERYSRPIMNFIYRMIGNAAEAEDVTQEVFVRAFQNIQKPALYQTTAAFSTWLFQVARNAALDCLRRKKRHPETSLTALEDGGDTTPGAGPTAAEAAVARETGERIAAAVALLPEDQRTAILLSEYEDFSDAQIAAVMKCTRKSVEARLYRARHFLRRQLAALLG